MRLKIGFSPCPNDTYIFYALIHQAIDTEGIVFEPFMADVEVLNKKAFSQDLDITKISFNAFLDLTRSHILLNAGSALGRNCGPLLISRQQLSTDQLLKQPIAIPGANTTANFLLDFYTPTKALKMVMPFDQIERSVLTGVAQAGVIIHENRFTYADRGLTKIADLGTHWEEKTGHPIPLGGIIGLRSLGTETLSKVDSLIRKSLQYAHDNRQEVLEYVRAHAQEMNASVMWQHIDLYVNQYSEDLGTDGKAAIDRFFAEAGKSGRVDRWKSPYILTEK